MQQNAQLKEKHNQMLQLKVTGNAGNALYGLNKSKQINIIPKFNMNR